jgi:hypothetical protein
MFFNVVADIQPVFDKTMEFFIAQAPGIQLIWGLGLLFFVGWLFFISALLFFKNRRKKIARRNAHHKQQVETFLTEALFSADEPEYEKISGTLIDKKYKRQLFIDSLIKLKTTFKGEFADKAIAIYNELGLTKDSIRKTESFNYHVIAKGLRELAIMQYPKIASLGLKFINSKNKTLREEAQLKIIEQHGFKVLYIFEEVTFPISKWQSIRILNTLKKFQASQDVDFEKLLASANPDVVVLAIRIIAINGLYPFAKHILKVVRHENPKVRTEAFAALGELNQYKYAELLNESLRIEQDRQVRLNIIRSMQEIGNENSYEILQQQLDDPDFSIAYEAAKTLRKHFEQESQESSHEKLQLLLARIQDENMD